MTANPSHFFMCIESLSPGSYSIDNTISPGFAVAPGAEDPPGWYDAQRRASAGGQQRRDATLLNAPLDALVGPSANTISWRISAGDHRRRPTEPTVVEAAPEHLHWIELSKGIPSRRFDLHFRGLGSTPIADIGDLDEL